ncbi:diiron oxygenase [Nocardia salmonicida]|uniref:AurF N-oxygenase family protein n=1 Tax=Nocardia salmonicida TaxID=53431 RepID=UPI0036794844
MAIEQNRIRVGDDLVDEAGAYADTLSLLSEGSVHRRFDPYLDIDWDDPDFDADTAPERWILTESGEMLGPHPWYRALPRDRQIAIGKYRQANIAKVGLQFELLLISGMVQHTYRLPNSSPEFRYCTHEIIEECNHNLMFQEMVNRIGIDVPGMTPWLKTLLGYVVSPAGALFPNLFFMGVLAGEEPIDHIQKAILRSGEEVHPIMRSVMAIHVAEEARHISFAHEFLKQRVPQADPVHKLGLSVALPIIMFALGRAIVTPPRAFFADVGIPDSVRKEAFYGLPDSKHAFADFFADVRALAAEIGLINPISSRVWKVLGIDGPTTRYRSEPLRHTAA